MTKKSCGYLGKMCSDLFGSLYNLYDSANEDSKHSTFCITYVNIIITSKDFGLLKRKQVRKFTVEIPKKDTSQTSNEGINGTIILHNKEPVWSEKFNAYMLDFKGKVSKPSMKNFILVDKRSERESVIFGKMDEDLYTLNVGWPLTIFQAFGLAISSITYKIGC